MPKKGNRRLPAGAGKKARASGAKGAGAKARGRGKRRPAAVDPAERKARNRTLLLLGVLAVINAYVFLLRGEGSLADLRGARAAVIGGAGGGALGAFAEAPESGCGDDPVRIFAAADELLRAEDVLDGPRPLAAALTRAGIGEDGIVAVEAAIQPTFDLGLLAGSRAPLRLASDRHGGLQALEIELGEGHLLQACRERGAYVVRTLQHPTSTDVAVVELELGRDADLAAALDAAGEPRELGPLIAEALAYDIDLMTEARPGDRIKVVVEKRYLGERFHRFGPLLGIRFAGEAASVTYHRYRPTGGEPELYTREGEPRRRTLRRSPVAFHMIAADARGLLAPTLEVITGRSGAMYRRPEGAPVVALGDARVRALGESGDAGLTLELELEGGLHLRYAHLSRVIGALAPGDVVRAGQLVGLAGHSGKTASDRVRVEMWREEGGEVAMLDPLFIQASGDGRPPRLGEALAGAELDRFREDTVSLGRLLR